MIELDAKFKTFELRDGALRNSVAKQNNETLKWSTKMMKNIPIFAIVRLKNISKKKLMVSFTSWFRILLWKNVYEKCLVAWIF